MSNAWWAAVCVCLQPLQLSDICSLPLCAESFDTREEGLRFCFDFVDKDRSG
jgi:hypothetical protein